MRGLLTAAAMAALLMVTPLAAQEGVDLGTLDQGLGEAPPGDVVFGVQAGGFEVRTGVPADDAEAARFLTQASFGPDEAAIGELKSIGYAAWLDQQIGTLPATLQRPALELQIAAAALANPLNAQVYRRFRMERWMATALYAPDQLRQRVAYALSQILVVSDVGALDNNPVGVAEFHDLLARNAFGNYRQLLSEVTYSPMMGTYLTYLRNRKTDWTLDANNQLVPSLIQPDENYAREVMQLFSIGLVERNRDFSPLLVNGQPVPTYTQAIISDTARAFTGLGYRCTGPATVGEIPLNRNCNCTGTACNFSNTVFFGNPPRYAANNQVTAVVHPDGYAPMICFPRYADSGRSQAQQNNFAVLPAPFDVKRIVAGITIPASPVACHSGTQGADQQACINYCQGQIDTVLSALFNHPNVAPMVARQLIQRLTTSSPTAGYIDRVAAVFENDGTGTRGNLGAVVRTVLMDPEARSATPGAGFGKLREPILRLTAIWRAFNAVPSSAGTTGVQTPEVAFLQRPLGAPTVFNFYEPDYQHPGELQNGGLFAPEFQILNESSAVTAGDELFRRIWAGYSVAGNATNFAIPANTAYLPPASLERLPRTSAALVDALGVLLLHGQMPTAMRSALITLADQMASVDHRRRVLSLTHLIAISPAFAVQR
jgi:uncharacterized protein (DUF1800 family)